MNKCLKPSMDPEKNPYAALLSKLSGIAPPKKKARQGFQQYMHEHPDILQPLFDAAWEKKKSEGLTSKKDRNDATCRAEIARKHFNQLSESEKKKYQEMAQADKLKDAKRYKAALEAAKAKSPANRLR